MDFYIAKVIIIRPLDAQNTMLHVHLSALFNACSSPTLQVARRLIDYRYDRKPGLRINGLLYHQREQRVCDFRSCKYRSLTQRLEFLQSKHDG